MEEIKELLVDVGVSIKQAWKKLNDNGYKILFVQDSEGHLLGSVTDGDVRRWILSDGLLSAFIDCVMCKSPVVAYERENRETIKGRMIENRIECLPVVNRNNVIRKVVFWDELFENGKKVELEKIDVPVVIMAGGKGERLTPFTKIVPKPLFPVGEKPIIEVIMKKFSDVGSNQFFISLNHKSSMIKAYFADCGHGWQVEFCEESMPLGTIGALSLLKNKISSTFMVSNADVLIDTNYADILRFHQKEKYKITLVCSMKHIKIPYGVVEMEKGGYLKGISEKPELDRLVLAGLYVLEPELLKMIPDAKRFDITQLIESLRLEEQKIGVYPISESAWMDIGEFGSYQDALQRFR